MQDFYVRYFIVQLLTLLAIGNSYRLQQASLTSGTCAWQAGIWWMQQHAIARPMLGATFKCTAGGLHLWKDGMHGTALASMPSWRHDKLFAH